MGTRPRQARAPPPPAPPSLVCLLACLLACLPALPAGAHHTPTDPLVTPTWDDWSSRAVYQVLTDRFAAPGRGAGTAPCADLSNYCGGSWAGILERLDYIQGLNLNAIWSSPVSLNSYGGYHGYWPTDLTGLNTYFGSQEDLADLLHTLAERGLFNILDVIFNHVGYGSDVHTPVFRPFGSPEHFNGCEGCGPNCEIPAQNATLEQQWDCRVSGLPDLNQSHPYVRQQLAGWVRSMQAQYSIHLLRMDAAGHVRPDFWPWFANQTSLPIWLEVFGDSNLTAEYERARGGATYSYLSMPLYGAAMACFANRDPYTFAPITPDCRMLSATRRQLHAMGADTRRMGAFCESHDQDRFLWRRNDMPAFRNALAHTLLREAIPVIYYGAEQGMDGWMTGGGNRAPLWEHGGYSVFHPLYTFIRTLAWYRWWMRLGVEPFQEVFVDSHSYVFSRGGKVLVVLTAGNYTPEDPRPPAYLLSGLQQFAGTSLCDALHSGYCVTVGPNGSAAVEPSPVNEPLVLVPEDWVRPPEFFTLLPARPVLWQRGLTITFATCAAAVLAFLLGLYGLHCWRARRFAPRADLLAAGRGQAGPGTPAASDRGHQRGASSSGSALQVARSTDLRLSLTGLALGEFPRSGAGEGASTSGEPPPLRSARVLEYLEVLKSRRPSTCLLHGLVDSLKADPGLVMHVCLEYAVPHLGLTSELMYGGLGKVVETFIRCATRPMIVCAPMYRPFFSEDGRPRHFANTAPIMTVPAVVNGSKHLVDVFITAGPTNGASPPVFFLLLSAGVFRRRNRSTIYQHASEEELAFFSVFNQAVAHVAESLGVASLQFHDYHGALSLMYLPPRPHLRAMLVAHNADYNGTWHLGSAEREAWVYSMLNIPLTPHTRSLCEHAGRFNMLRPLIEHMRLWQQGLGVVAVSPRYALRCWDKFSVMWALPRGAVGGILNGLEAESGERPAEGAELACFFGRKASAKIAFQLAKGLQVGEHHRMLVFLGRITHQKGCDIIALAAADILRACPTAQIVMAGPVGDEYGERARVLLDKVAAEFPGSVWNGAGQYIAGEDKDQLCMAADFFLCPSRFEPCGLADIEFGWLGAVQIGHNTGGLGKMPGFYYTAELDCTEDQALRLAGAALKALSAPRKEIRRLAEQALQAEFPPSRMVRQYERQWGRLHALPKAPLHREGVALGPAEKSFYSETWLDDNVPYSAAEAPQWQARRAQQEHLGWARNLLLIVMQARCALGAVMHLPSVLSLLWWSDCLKAGSIQYQATPSFGSIAASPTAIYFYTYAGSALLFQALGVLLCPLRYIQLAACFNVISVLLMLWALWAPQAAEVFYLLNASTAASWGPMAAFIFLDMPRVSVSQHGPAVMGVSDTLQRAMGVVAVMALIRSQGSADFFAFQAVGIVLLVLAIWFALWLLRPAALSPHFRHCRLRLRGAAPLLARARRAWAAATAITSLDSFASGFLLSTIYKLKFEDDTQWYMLAYALALVAASAALGVLLMSRLGRRLGLRLMYGLAALPGVVLLQSILVMYCGVAGLYIAATVVGALHVRTSMVGLLCLHTLPTRETFTLVKTLQVVLGSLVIVLGLAAGACTDSLGQIWAAACCYEAARMALAAALVWLHRRENIAKP
ncbi:hypothetical protein ABPG75_013810 [Micractinium tetrahymenae]